MKEMVQKKLEGEEGVDWTVDEMQLLFKVRRMWWWWWWWCMFLVVYVSP